MRTHFTVALLAASLFGCDSDNTQAFADEDQQNLIAPDINFTKAAIDAGYISLPATIEGEDFVSQRGISIGQTDDSGGSDYLGWINDGDFSKYHIDVPQDGTYKIEARVASKNQTSEINFSSDGNSSTVEVTPTGNWNSWKTVSTTLQLSSGDQVLRLGYIGDSDSYLVNINWLSIESTDTDSTIGVRSGNWIVNDNNERSENIFEENSNTGVLVNVESVKRKTIDGADYIRIKASGIPNYKVTVDQDILDTLAARPNSTDDFRGGTTSIDIGDVVEFGQDIRYKSSTENCNSTGGFGYWPPGPVCPQDVDTVVLFTTEPTVSTSQCNTGLGTIGLFSNGTAIYDWDDGKTYQNENVWQHIAANAEIHDFDICGGHSAAEYHHHNYSACLANELEDNGDAHSPVYGVSADGYPVHGPWFAKNKLVVSSWLTRDYDNASSETGCGESGRRSCLLVDQYDITKGTTPIGRRGPSTSDEILSSTNNLISAESGLYFQDYYYDPALTAMGGVYLDRHNGHEHDGLGYHYHLTIEKNTDGSFKPTFPFTFGPTFKGELGDRALRACAAG